MWFGDLQSGFLRPVVAAEVALAVAMDSRSPAAEARQDRCYGRPCQGEHQAASDSGAPGPEGEHHEAEGDPAEDAAQNERAVATCAGVRHDGCIRRAVSHHLR